MATMQDPERAGETLRDALAAEGWTVTEVAENLRGMRQRLSPGMVQYDLAQERFRRKRAAA